jgi:hypothetical protein
MFNPRSVDDEISLATNLERLSELRDYLAEMVRDTLNRYDLTPQERASICTDILNDVPTAVELFLDRDRHLNARYRFSEYFMFYVKRRLAAVPSLRRRPKA